jgi:hypothetical protein
MFSGIHPVLLDVTPLTPQQSSAAMYHDLKTLGIALTVFIGIAIVSVFLEHLGKLMEPLQDAGISIPFWPTFVILSALALLFGYPEMHDYYEAGHIFYAYAKIQTIQMDAINDLLAGPLDSCTAQEAQLKMNGAQAEAYETLGQPDVAARIRASQAADPQCPPVEIAPDT